MHRASDLANSRSETKLAVRPGRTARLKALNRCNVSLVIAHSSLIEISRPCIRGKIFQGCEVRTVLPAPVFRRLQQPASNTLTLLPPAYRDLHDHAIEEFPVHGIGGALEPGIDE